VVDFLKTLGGKMKRVLQVSLVLAAMLGMFAACSPTAIPTAPFTIAPTTAQADTQPVEAAALAATDAASLRTISVIGSGQVYLVPDVAYVYIGVHSQSDNVSAALKQNNEQAKQVSDALKALKVEEKDIQTTSFNIYPQQQYEPGTGNVTGTFYSVDNTVYVTVRDLKQLGELLDTVVRSGANSINGINFDVVDKESALSKARELAISNARKQAEELAKLSGVTLGDIQYISTGTASSPMAKEMYGMGGGGGMASSVQTPISAGQLVLSVDVSLTFQVK
jgi:uncharacterized protein YggE